MSGRSFMYITNSIGPSTLPWGMPLVTAADADRASLTLTHCVLFERKDLIHPSILLVIPYFFILWIRRRCGTLSKAFIKSQYTASSLPPWSMISVHMFRTCSNCSTVDLPVIKPNCCWLNRLFSTIWSITLSLIKFSRVLQMMLVKLTGL